MNTAHLTVGASYTSGYGKGRQAAKGHVPETDNPFRRGSPAFHGWNDGHYDERSARRLAVDRHNALHLSSVETGSFRDQVG
jgi:hypothetical protein